MALDDVVKTTITGPRIEEAMYRTLRWIDRCIAGNYTCIYILVFQCHAKEHFKCFFINFSFSLFGWEKLVLVVH